MSRFTLAVAAASALTVLGVTIAVAGVVEDRQATMKSFGPATKDALGLKNGTIPYDAAKVKSVMQIYLDGANKLTADFAPKPGPDDKTKAAPKIWEDAAGFKAEVAKFTADVKAASAAPDQAAFTVAFSKVQADCSSCHGAYRVK